MGLLEVTSDGLRTLAARCHALGVEIGGCSVHTAVEAGGQATADAVNTAHSGAARAAEAMVARMWDTAVALEGAGSCYALEEGRSTAALRRLIGEV